MILMRLMSINFLCTLVFIGSVYNIDLNSNNKSKFFLKNEPVDKCFCKVSFSLLFNQNIKFVKIILQ